MDPSMLYDQIASQDWIEWAGLVTGLLYVFLAAYQRPSCWIFGIISSAAIAWKSFTDYRLIADGILQVFYIIIGFVGLYHWVDGRLNQAPKRIITSPFRHHLVAICICLLLSFPISWWLIHYVNARYGYVDTLLALVSVYATILLVRKDLHNWVYWIVIDIVYVGLYLKSEGYLFAVLFFIYAIVSVWGWKRWQWESVRMRECESVRVRESERVRE